MGEKANMQRIIFLKCYKDLSSTVIYQYLIDSFTKYLNQSLYQSKIHREYLTWIFK